MVEAARTAGVDARLADAQTLKMDEKFDAVLSNDALHWMPDQYAVVRRVWNLLKPGDASPPSAEARAACASYARA